MKQKRFWAIGQLGNSEKYNSPSYKAREILGNWATLENTTLLFYAGGGFGQLGNWATLKNTSFLFYAEGALGDWANGQLWKILPYLFKKQKWIWASGRLGNSEKYSSPFCKVEGT